MNALFTKKQNLQNKSKFRTTKEVIENLYLQKTMHEKKFFDYEKQLEGIQYHILEIRNHQKHHREKIFALDKEIQKHNKKQKPAKQKYNYTSFYVFAGLLIAIFIAALYFLFTEFIAI
ncbi:hypothetical protein Fleli_1594 [Bernardetia litoralis DSM 6794]|uniref:Uncharacterized protein n=1 Tax=Bernardetia litoralis (strain ATCC 23117 / DSM 6794 / NBRC 15988 / NCIMB 1366 / Fx l1 / Sio-4) TaxID=880071 RepID=I4AJ77_BERLS|nr:hypothetical protein [Bernardetia litoralis]AFM04012.1 hypothetical protein Fleli_1594 [Bernardetia litoralis DSM 6794]